MLFFTVCGIFGRLEMTTASKEKHGPLCRYTVQLLHISTHTQAVVPPATTAENYTTGMSQPRHSQQGMPNSNAGTGTLSEASIEPVDTLPTPNTTAGCIRLSLQQVPTANRFEITTLALLQGSICYVDASTQPNHQNLQSRSAGLGIFILNF